MDSSCKPQQTRIVLESCPQRTDSGETLAFLILWPTMFVAVLLLLVHTFIVVNAQSQAELAASEGLRAAWRSAAAADFRTEPGGSDPYMLNEPHPDVLGMADAARDAAAGVAGEEQGWRWWTPGSTEVKSNWCMQISSRPGPRQAGWVQVKVQGEVFGPMAALWPGRLDKVYAVATGPALIGESVDLPLEGYVVPPQSELEVC